MLAALFYLMFLLPWPDLIRTSGILQPQIRMSLYAPAQSRVEALPVANGQPVQAGQPLLRLSSPELDLRTGEAGARHDALSWQSAAAGLDATTRKDWLILNDQLAFSNAEQAAVDVDFQRYRPVAPYAGVLADVDPDLRPGQWLKNQEYLGSLVTAGPWQVVTYVNEEAVHRIRQGDRALFIADGLGSPALRLTMAGIDRDATRTMGEPELATVFGGDVLAREKSGVLYPEQAVFRVTLNVAEALPAEQQEWRGRVAIAAQWEVPALRFLRTAASVAWRETGF